MPIASVTLSAAASTRRIPARVVRMRAPPAAAAAAAAGTSGNPPAAVGPPSAAAAGGSTAAAAAGTAASSTWSAWSPAVTATRSLNESGPLPMMS
jgi:hypothetical protein